MTFDLRGRKVGMSDPDLGAWTYAYNAFDELTSQTDAKGQTVTQGYDALGRMSTRTELEGTTTWAYDSAANGVGKPASVFAPGGYAQTYTYDALGRPIRTRTVLDTVTYDADTGYDALSRPQSLTYPSGFAVKQAYTAQGYLASVRDNATNALYWQADAARPDGTVSAFSLGNGLSTVRLYDTRTGNLNFVSTGVGAGTTVQSLSYTWDALGNLTQRRDMNQNLTENFTYDALNRLTQASIAGLGSKTYAYNAIGNLTSKSDVGSYTYGTKPHAVTQAGANTYAYDANGNMTTGAGRTLTWSSANLATEITQSGAASSFVYGPDRSRWKHIKVVGAQTTTTRYVGGLYEESVAAGVTEKKHYIFAGGERIAIYATKTSGTSSLKYLHQDHLGSTDAVSDASGAVIERLSYDPHGKRRNANWSTAAGILASVSTDRGFTDHEHLDELGLIHMNGRIYDPTLGRFLSADPTVQFPEASQSLNRYSYVLNNPLSFTDPTGFGIGSFFKSVGKAFKSAARWISKNWRTIAAVAVTAIPGVNVALLGFASGMIASGGDLRTGLIGALTAGAYAGLHGWQPNSFSLGKVFAHGVVGGVSARLQGGKFGAGFLSAGFTQSLSQTPFFDAVGGDPTTWGGRVRNATAAAVAGGTASEIGGGKFANGAVTGAFSRMFNDIKITNELDRYEEILRIGNINIDENMAQARAMDLVEFYDALKTGGPWDYKNNSTLIRAGIDPDLLQEFGNFHYGAVSRAFGANLATSLFDAGAYQVLRQGGGNIPHLLVGGAAMYVTRGGIYFGNGAATWVTTRGFTWGDNPGDSRSIMKGWKYNENR